MKIARIDEAVLLEAMKGLPGWQKLSGRDALAKSFKFAHFRQTFAFMSEIAMLAEKADHHPEWTNVYNRLDIVLTTHEAGGISERDIALAVEIEKIVSRA
jgi:4a-hydroxytetrahydrobiopterin dehydratase